MKKFIPFILLAAFLSIGGDLPDKVIQAPSTDESVSLDIEHGAPFKPLDSLASLLASPIKLLLWNSHYGTHKISPETQTALEHFIKDNHLTKVKIRINQSAPFQEVARIIKNKEVGLPYRILAIPFSFITSASGRLFAGLIFSDYYTKNFQTHSRAFNCNVSCHYFANDFSF